MAGSRSVLPSLIPWAGVLAAAALVPGAAWAGQYPQSTLTPHSDVGWMIQHLLENIVWWCTGIFIVVFGILLYAIFRFRRRGESQVPEAVHGHSGMEIAWTIAPAVILFFIAVPTIATIYKIGNDNPSATVHVNVVGHQWWWEFQYPDPQHPDQVMLTANELHLPVGRTVSFDLRTGDVIHSFWIPGLCGKRDVEANHINHMWFTPDTTGVFYGQCGEYCGTSHGNMRMRCVVQKPEEYEAWLQAQKGPGAPPTQLEAKGQEVFTHQVCVACHTIQGVSAGILGPNLTHVGSRSMIGAGLMENTPENLAAWIKHTEAIKPGTMMWQMTKDMKLSDGDLQALVAYLESRK